ncbi:Ubiquinone biosynthesis O-methyltransferase [Planctomycetes bacterium Poly30]|uniref:Ubiquinone biosynthesis O-methyltransferase n=1 Tax=Saltatorellus ferox TaxID=2528018 RepID=A0A518EUX7_9BACT|nr:Ubiquinone biosynthesis O-methyltransferase [Planctomycetes bacterium Poly30]
MSPPGATSDPPDSFGAPTLDLAAAEKLPHEALHLESLERMAGLRPYYDWVLELAETLNGGPLGKRVLDAGCGIGNFVELLRHRAEHVMAVDLSPKNVAVLRSRFEDAANVEVLQTDLDVQREELRARSVDAICCLDVLEHIQDDAALVRSFAGILPEGGTLFVKVPAHQWLYGSVDEASDHHRRYGRKQLMRLVEGAGFRVERARYMNMAGVGPYFLKSRVLKKGSTFSNSFSQRQLRWIKRSIGVFRGADRVAGLLGPGGGPPVGQSVVLIARREG